jgi:hypothetical protein
VGRAQTANISTILRALIAAKCQTSLVRSSPVRTFSITRQPRDGNFGLKYFPLRKALRLGPRARRGSQLPRTAPGPPG